MNRWSVLFTDPGFFETLPVRLEEKLESLRLAAPDRTAAQLLLATALGLEQPLPRSVLVVNCGRADVAQPQILSVAPRAR